MKKISFLFFLVCLFSFQNSQAQTVESSVTVKKQNETYFVSGIVWSEQVKNRIVEIIKNETQKNVDAGKLMIGDVSSYFGNDWQARFTKQISRTKNLKTAFVMFQDNSDSYPNLPEKLLNAEITLTGNDTIRLQDFNDEIVVLSFVADWSAPDRLTIGVLNKLYDENLKNVRFIALNIDADDKNSVQDFEKFVKKMNIKFQTGSAGKELLDGFFQISNFRGIPQTFVLKNGKLRGVFLGAGENVNKKMIEVIKSISKE